MNVQALLDAPMPEPAPAGSDDDKVGDARSFLVSKYSWFHMALR
jgi:hypothetical protein